MQHVIDILRAHSSPLAPQPTATPPQLPALAGLKGIVFDIYGTLFISGSGDIGVAQNSSRDDLLRAALAENGVLLASEKTALADTFLQLIRQDHASTRARGITYPEVDIREIWSQFLLRHCPGTPPTQDLTERLAARYETATNPIWPMPHLAETLALLREKGLLLGIVSNAQFYTRRLFPAFLEASAWDLGFLRELSVWSYKIREAKPSPRLYQLLAEALAEKGIQPAEILYLGNDMRNDIRPAHQIGFRTALFAGDARSLRLRENDPDPMPAPDAVVTSLDQLPSLLGS